MSVIASADSVAEMLEKYFDTAFSAPEGIKKLRELILTLAMQGKLVPQDPNDQPASELLKEIEAEKQRLVKEGKIKKQKPLPPIKPEEMPYDLPQGWEWVRLGNIGLINPRNVAEDSVISGFVPMILIPEGYSEKLQYEVRKWGDIKKGYTHLANGDIGMAKITPCFENAKSCVFSDLPNGIGAGTTELHIFRNLYNSVDPRFLLYYLKNPKYISSAALKMTGSAGQKRIPTPYFSSQLFPLPPFSEQHRTVAKIDQLMARCDELEKLREEREKKQITVHTSAIKELLDAKSEQSLADAWQFLKRNFNELYSVKENVTELRKAILQLAVMGKLVPQDPNDPPASELLKEIEAEKQRLLKEGKIKKQKPLPPIKPEEVPYELPQGWEWVRFGNLVQVLNGRAFKQNELLESGIPVLRVGNLFTSNKWYYSDLVLDEDKYIEKGDLIYAWSASFGPFIWGGNRVIYHYHIWKVKFFIADFPEKKYLYNYLLEATDRIKISDSGIAMLYMTKNGIEKMIVPVPPFSEQYRIVVKIDQLMALCDLLERHIEASGDKQDKLLNAIMVNV